MNTETRRRNSIIKGRDEIGRTKNNHKGEEQ